MSDPAETILPESDETTSLEASFRALGDRLEAIKTKPNRATLALMLHAGGDRRIWPDPVSGRNRYGLRATPAPSEISFASTTASTISPMSFEAVGYTYSRLFEVGYGAGLTLSKWVSELRARLLDALANPRDQAIFAASGTDATIIALSLVRAFAPGPVTSILFAPEETGAGVPSAAAGRHFSDMTALGTMVSPGEAIAGIGEDVEMDIVPIRSERSVPRSQADIDADVERRVDAALKAGRTVIITLLDTAKTGIGSMSRAMAKTLVDRAPGRVHVIVDACQLRCSRATIKADLEAGHLVTITGSKYIAGPAFCGAVLIPQGLADALSGLTSLAPGLVDYVSAFDLPQSLRHLVGPGVKSEANLGLGFRWTAALEHLDQLIKVDEATENLILEKFASLARDLARHTLSASLDIDELQQDRASNILALGITDTAGKFLSKEKAADLYLALRENERMGPICHLGQPVALDIAPVIRVSASATDVLETADRLAEGMSLDAAFEPIRRRLETVFEKWNRIILGDQ